jgi:hypothetical protein
MFDIDSRINIHGQRKIVHADLMLLTSPTPNANDILSLGWQRVSGDRGIMATIFRGVLDDTHIDDWTRTLAKGNIVSERYLTIRDAANTEYYILRNFLDLVRIQRYSLVIKGQFLRLLH